MLRFEAIRQLSEGAIAAEPEELRALQTRTCREIKRYGYEHSLALIARSEKYLARLSQLQKELTMGGQIEEARTVNAEIKQVESSEELDAARQEVERWRNPQGGTSEEPAN
jgi:hypothetical protein